MGDPDALIFSKRLVKRLGDNSQLVLSEKIDITPFE